MWRCYKFLLRAVLSLDPEFWRHTLHRASNSISMQDDRGISQNQYPLVEVEDVVQRWTANSKWPVKPDMLLLNILKLRDLHGSVWKYGGYLELSPHCTNIVSQRGDIHVGAALQARNTALRNIQ